jgi:predicted transcriptional regulator
MEDSKARWGDITTIRLPKELRQRIDDAAKRQAQSRSAEIRRTLAAAYQPEPVR